MKMSLQITCWLFLTLFAVAESLADQRQPEITPIDQLMKMEVTSVTGASKYQQELTDAPAAVTIVTSEDIRLGGYRNLAEILNSVRGFYITYNRSYHFAGTRGFSPLGDYNTRILLLIDGHRINDAVYEQAPVGTDFPVDIDLIDRIEVIRGPGSSLYGTNAFLAVVNVITREGKSLKGGELSASGGSYNAWTGRVTGGGKSATGVDLLFSGSYRDSVGRQQLSYPEFAATNGGIAQRLDGEGTWDVFAKGAWKDLSMILLHQTRDKAVPTAPYSTIFNDPAQKTTDRRTLAGLFFSRSSAVANLNARLTYNRYEYDAYYPLDNAGVRTLNRDLTVAEWIGTDLYLSKNLGRHLLTIGMEHRWLFNQLQKNHDVSPPAAAILDDTRRSLVQGYYLQDEYHIRNNLILNAGVRLDSYEEFAPAVNPRAALIWKPRSDTVLRITYGEAFRAPNAYEKYYTDITSAKGNTALKPEKLRSLELGWDQFIGENIRTTVSGFYTRITDMLEQTTDPTDGLLVFMNRNSVESKGAELQAESKWENGVIGRVSYSYQEAVNIKTNQLMANSPKNLAKGSLTVPFPSLKGHFATVEALYSGSRKNFSGENIEGATVVNLTMLSRELLKGLDISVSVYNLFDTRYSMPAGPDQVNSLSETLSGIGQDGIAFRIKATWKF